MCNKVVNFSFLIILAFLTSINFLPIKCDNNYRTHTREIGPRSWIIQVEQLPPAVELEDNFKIRILRNTATPTQFTLPASEATPEPGQRTLQTRVGKDVTLGPLENLFPNEPARPNEVPFVSPQVTTPTLVELPTKSPNPETKPDENVMSEIKKLELAIGNLTEALIDFKRENSKYHRQVKFALAEIEANTMHKYKMKSFPSDCRNAPGKISGQHQLLLPGFDLPTLIYCHMELFGGGWAVILNRFNGQVDFYQGLFSYMAGFGKMDNEFWIGFQTLSGLMANQTMELLVLLEDFDGETRFAFYKTFAIDNNDKFKLTIGDYEGDAGDSLSYANGAHFSTYDADADMDPDRNCCIEYRSAGWHKNCTEANLFGLYLSGKSVDRSGQGMFWKTFRGVDYSLRSIKLLVRTKFT